MLGKRKRDTTVASRRSRDESSHPRPKPPDIKAGNADEIFKRFFETNFEPLAPIAIETSPPSSSEDDDSLSERSRDDVTSDVASEWRGISDQEGEVEVFDYSASRQDHHEAIADKITRRKFMVCHSTNPEIISTPIISHPRLHRF